MVDAHGNFEPTLGCPAQRGYGDPYVALENVVNRRHAVTVVAAVPGAVHDVLGLALALHDRMMTHAPGPFAARLRTLQQRVTAVLNPRLRVDISAASDGAAAPLRVRLLLDRRPHPAAAPDETVVADVAVPLPNAADDDDARADRLLALEALGYALFRTLERIPATFNVPVDVSLAGVETPAVDAYMRRRESARLAALKLDGPCTPVQVPVLHSLFSVLDLYRFLYDAVGLYWLLPLFYVCTVPDDAWDNLRLDLSPTLEPPANVCAAQLVRAFHADPDGPARLAFLDAITRSARCPRRSARWRQRRNGDAGMRRAIYVTVCAGLPVAAVVVADHDAAHPTGDLRVVRMCVVHDFVCTETLLHAVRADNPAAALFVPRGVSDEPVPKDDKKRHRLA